MIDSKSLYITLDGFIRAHDGTRYFALFGDEKYDFILNRIRYLIRVKSRNTCIISHNCPKVKVHSNDYLPLEETMTFHNLLIPITSVWNKDQNDYHYNMFLKKASHELPKK